MGKIAGIFPIGDTGEEFGVAEWYPDPDVVANELFKLANDLENWTEPLTEARSAFIYDTELHFETQSDPYGRAWQALEQNYLLDKLAAGFPDEILTRSGDLRRAATSQEAWMITEREIIFRTEKLPFYGPYHQAGTQEGAKSDVLGGALDKLLGGRALTSEETAAINKGGHGLSLPQRMFIGADEDTIAEVEAIFVAWLNKTVDKDISFGPPIISLGSNKMETLPIIGMTKSGQPRLASGRFGKRI